MEDRIPGPRGRRFVGDLPAYERDPIGWLTRGRDEYGDLVRLAPNAVAVHDAEAAYEVLAGTNRDFLLDNAVRIDQLDEIQERMPEWMRRRRWITRGIGRHLTPEHSARMADLLVEELDRYAGMPDDLVTLCRKVCSRANVRFVIGDDSAPDLIDAAATAFDDWMRVIETSEVRVRWLPRPAARRSGKSTARLREMLAEHVAWRRTSEPAATRRTSATLFDEVATEVDDPAELVSAAFTLVFSTQGLPGVTMSWLLVELAGHPELAEDMRKEVAGKSVVSDDLPLTAAFVHEVLRLHPPQWLVSRTTTRPAELAGYTVPAGQQVLVCPYLIHRDKRWWDEPESFDPGRWLHGRCPAKAFLPFGAGPRHCPGYQLAMVQMIALPPCSSRPTP